MGKGAEVSTVTRTSLATEWEREDAIVEAANRQKRDGANRYRAQLAAKGWSKEDIKAELEAFRKAFARARQITKHGITTVEEADARVEEILAEIRGSNAPRVTRVENIDEIGADDEPEHDPETGEIIETNSALETPAADDGEGTVAPSSLANPIQPSESTATQSTAPRSDVGDNSTEDGPRKPSLDPAAATTPPAGEAPPVDTNSPDEGNEAAGTRPVPSVRVEAPPAPVQGPPEQQRNTMGVTSQGGEQTLHTNSPHTEADRADSSPQAADGSSNSEPDEGEAGESPAAAPAPQAGEATVHASLVLPPSRDGLYRADWLRRNGHCLSLDTCVHKPGRLCAGCSKALAANVAPVGLTIGAADIPHGGLVN